MKENEKLDSHRLALLCKSDWKCNELNDNNMMWNMIKVSPGVGRRISVACHWLEIAVNKTNFHRVYLTFHSISVHPFRIPHINNVEECMICLCRGYSPIKLRKQTLMDDNECEHYLWIEWPLIFMIVFIQAHYKPKQHQYSSEQVSVRIYIYQWLDN